MSTASIVTIYKIEDRRIWTIDRERALNPAEILLAETDKGFNATRDFFKEFGASWEDNFPSVERDGITFWKLYSPEGVTYFEPHKLLEDYGIEGSDAFFSALERRAAKAKEAVALDSDDGEETRGQKRARKKLEKTMKRQAKLKAMPGGVNYDADAPKAERRAKPERTPRAERSAEPRVSGEYAEQIAKILIDRTLEVPMSESGSIGRLAKEIGFAAKTDDVDCLVSGVGTICKFVEDGRKRVHEGRKIFENARVTDAGRVWMTLSYEGKTWYVKSWAGEFTSRFAIPNETSELSAAEDES